MDLSDSGKLPISGINPAGRDVMYEPDYEALVEEINKLSSPSSVETIDWKKVVLLGSRILREQSKNLTAACYLSYGLLQDQGISGLADGIHVLRDMLEEYWETMYPPVRRQKARINTIAWWNEKLQSALKNSGPEPMASSRAELLLTDLKVIDGILAEKLEDGPSLNPLIEKITAIASPDTAAAPAQPQAEAKLSATPEPATGGQQAGQTRASSRSVDNAPDSPVDTDAATFFKKGLDRLRESATLLFNQDASNFLSYRLNRIIAWYGVDTLPPSVDDKTMIDPPDSQLQVLLTGLYQSGKWEELLRAAESRVREYLFWFDLAFWVYAALEALGFETAKRSVAADTSLLLSRIRGIERLHFSDGTPFAAVETRAWLSSLDRQSEPQSIKSDLTAQAAGQENPADLAEAEKRMAADGQGAMLSYMQARISSTRAYRDRFLLHIGLCGLLLKKKQVHIATPFIEHLLAEIDKYGLETWEPDLAVDAMVVCYQCLRLEDKKGNDGVLRDLFSRITLLNAQKGLEII